MRQIVQFNELSKSSLLALSFFLDNPTNEFSYTEIRKRVRLAKATLSKVLKFLTSRDFLNYRKIGVTKLYKINTKNFLVKQFKILYNLTKLVFLTDIAVRHECEVFLYGSAARGEDTEKSDIDLLIIGEVNEGKLKSEIKKIELKLKKNIALHFFTKIEWAEMVKKDKAFYERVEKDKIKIV